jgi:hypothetical protein
LIPLFIGFTFFSWYVARDEARKVLIISHHPCATYDCLMGNPYHCEVYHITLTIFIRLSW